MLGPNNYEVSRLVQRFEEMKNQSRAEFFDIEELELIADYYYFSGKASDAIEVMEFGSMQHPFSSVFPLKKSQYLIDENRLDEVRSELRRAETLDPNNPELFITHAELLSRSGQHHKAIIQLKKAHRLDEEDIEVLLMIAQEYTELNDYNKAKFYFIKVLEKDAEEASALFNLVHCYEMLDESEKAIKFLTEFIDRNPYSEIAWHHLGIQYGRTGNLEKSLWAFEYAIICDEFFTATYYEMGRILEEYERVQQAIDVYKKVLEFDEFSSYAYMRMGLAYKLINKFDQAEKYLKKAYKDDPYLEEAVLNLVVLYEERADYGKALFYVRKLVQLDANPQFLIFAAAISHKAGQSEKGLTMLNGLLSDGENDLEIYLVYSEILLDMLDIDGALNMLEEGLEQHPEHAALLFRKSLICYILGDDNLGLQLFNKALKKFNPLDLSEFIERFPHFTQQPDIHAILEDLGYLNDELPF